VGDVLLNNLKQQIEAAGVTVEFRLTASGGVLICGSQVSHPSFLLPAVRMVAHRNIVWIGSGGGGMDLSRCQVTTSPTHIHIAASLTLLFSPPLYSALMYTAAPPGNSAEGDRQQLRDRGTSGARILGGEKGTVPAVRLRVDSVP
jgi:hypothetical protein